MYGVPGTACEQRPEKAVATGIGGLGKVGWWVQRLKGLPVCPRDSAEAGAEAGGHRARKAAGRSGEGLAGCAGSGSSWLEVCVSAGVGGVTGPPWCWEQTQRASCREACRPGGEAGAWQVGGGGPEGRAGGRVLPAPLPHGRGRVGPTWLPWLPPPPGARVLGRLRTVEPRTGADRFPRGRGLAPGDSGGGAVLGSSQLRSLTNSPLFPL